MSADRYRGREQERMSRSQAHRLAEVDASVHAYIMGRRRRGVPFTGREWSE